MNKWDAQKLVLNGVGLGLCIGLIIGMTIGILLMAFIK
jgi:hypothetical protein